MIPYQFQNPNLRFIKVAIDDKKPIECDWVKTNNYQINDLRLLNHIVLNRANYGVATGNGNLIVLDFDSADAYNQLRPYLPKTFTVITANKKLPHVYYYVTNFEGPQPKSKKFINDKKETLIDLQGEGKQVVAPYSKIKDREYKVWIDESIATIDYKLLIRLLEHLFVPMKSFVPIKKQMPMHTISDRRDIFDEVTIPQILSRLGVSITNKTHACCPMHSSVNEKCLHYDEHRWWCFSCSSGGHSQHLIMAAKNCSWHEAKDWLKKEFRL